VDRGGVVSLPEFLVPLLRDPVDHGVLTYVAARDLLYNPRRRVAYEVRDGIAVMLPDEGRAIDEAEHQALLADPTGRTTGDP
jgi:uncharacterized protein YbaR (Trm112 family)